MKKSIIVLITIGLILLISGIVMAANTDNHTVTITVSAVNELAITGVDPILVISAATAGSGLTNATDNTCALDWTTNSSVNKKVTGQLDTDYSAGIALAVNVTVAGGNGASAGQQTLISASAVDLVTGMHNEFVSANTLGYTASAPTASPASETKTVTYTILDQ
ncbi:hypothetical protein KAU39_04345 [bacterium]|nr:hypothetical protein [bacterium]